MLGKQMPGIGVEQILDKSLTGAFLMQTYGAEKRIPLDNTAEHAQKNVRSFCMTNGKLLDTETLGEHAQLAALILAEDINPTVLLINFGETGGKFGGGGKTEIRVRAYAKEGMQKQHSAEKVIDKLESFLTGNDGVLDAILKEFEL